MLEPEKFFYFQLFPVKLKVTFSKFRIDFIRNLRLEFMSYNTLIKIIFTFSLKYKGAKAIFDPCSLLSNLQQRT